MKYTKFLDTWVAEPQNWKELQFTLHNEEPFIKYNPHRTTSKAQEALDILAMF